MSIKLGQKVKDTITGLEGIAIARTEWLYGCKRITIQPQGVTDDNKPADPVFVDEPQCEVVEDKPAPKTKDKHGPRPHDIGRPVDSRRN